MWRAQKGTMRVGLAVFVAVWVAGSAAAQTAGGDLRCGTSADNDRRVLALHSRLSRPPGRVAGEGARVAADAAVVRDGAIYLQANDEITPGYRAFDLEGESLLFRPGSEGRYAVSREPLRYTEPSSTGKLTAQFVPADLGFTFSAFGRDVQRVYIAAFIGITFDEPHYDLATSFSQVEALMHSQPLIAPLAETSKSLRVLPYIYVDHTPSSLIVTWRSFDHPTFGYDIQAQLNADGSIVFSYKSLRNMRWGAPVLSAGGAQRRTLFDVEAAKGTTSQADPAFQDMLDIRRVEVFRLADSEVVSIRLTLGAPIDQSRIKDGQWLTYEAFLSTDQGVDDVVLQVTPKDTFVTEYDSANLEHLTGQFDANTVEFFGIQRSPAPVSVQKLDALTLISGAGRPVDFTEYAFALDAVPLRLATDLSASNGSELALPIIESFPLPALDPLAVWDQLKTGFGFRDDEIDGVAIYQSFFTDIILYATAFSITGNPQVDGIHPPSSAGGTSKPRSPTLMHLNQLNYDENGDDKLASAVALHEFGHRWLYKLALNDGGSSSNVLNPQSEHPAAYVDTRSAFAMYGPEESSVMGGGFFTNISGNRYRARSLRYGYSWTDLYLMGLAEAQEVPAWFYLASTNPKLPSAYFPTDGIEVTGTKRDVQLSQVIAAQGPRNPPAAQSQHDFRVLFVLITDPGKEPTAEEIGKIEWLRTAMERDFTRATGGRGRLTTNRPPPPRRRAVR
jgi:hypothetical protein